MYNQVTSKENGSSSKCLLLTIDIFYIRHCSPCVGHESPDWIITISVLAQKQRWHGELIRRAIWKLHWHLKKLLYDEINDLFWIRAKLITTLSMRHAYIGPLDGGSGRGESISYISNYEDIICILQCLSDSYMFNDDKV